MECPSVAVIHRTPEGVIATASLEVRCPHCHTKLGIIVRSDLGAHDVAEVLAQLDTYAAWVDESWRVTHPVWECRPDRQPRRSSSSLF